MEPISVYRQDRIRTRFEKDIEQDRLAPSIIFHGLPGLGKERMAFYLAQVMFCREEKVGACGKCLSCRKVTKLLHPDLQWLFPKPGTVKDDELETIVEKKAGEQFFKPTFAKNVSHAIDAIRHLRTISGKRPYEADHKVFIMSDGDRMTVEAANAFLKLLEEPPDNTVIVITTSRLHALLPTIRSRCEEVRFSPLPVGVTNDVLSGELGLSPDVADHLARSCEGSVGRAVLMARQEGKDGWDDAWDMFQIAVQGEDSDLYAYVVGSKILRDRERVRMALDMLAGLLRDVIAVNIGLEQSEMINVPRYDMIKGHDALPVDGLVRASKLVEEARRLLDRNMSVSIFLWHLLHNISVSLHPGGGPYSRTDLSRSKETM